MATKINISKQWIKWDLLLSTFSRAKEKTNFCQIAKTIWMFCKVNSIKAFRLKLNQEYNVAALDFEAWNMMECKTIKQLMSPQLWGAASGFDTRLANVGSWDEWRFFCIARWSKHLINMRLCSYWIGIMF